MKARFCQPYSSVFKPGNSPWNSSAILIFLLVLSSTVPLQAQTVAASTVTQLSNPIEETSGLLHWNGRLITHNDSGDGPFLYEIDSTNGTVLRTVFINNASSQDWEAICHDDTYLYIGDFGNNNGTRTNLRIFRVAQSDYLNSDTVNADTISFSYADQTSFASNTFQTNFDAEAFVALGDSLYIFTKNWGNFRSNIYPMPKLPGTYSVIKSDSIMTQGLVTGATFEPISNTIFLVGYDFTSQFVYRILQPTGLPFSQPGNQRFSLTVPAATQTEAIAPLDSNSYLVTAEASSGQAAHLYKFSSPVLVGTEGVLSEELLIFPNPSSDWISVSARDIASLELWSMDGKLQLQTQQDSLFVGDLPAGNYSLRIVNSKGKFTTRKVSLQH